MNRSKLVVPCSFLEVQYSSWGQRIMTRHHKDWFVIEALQFTRGSLCFKQLVYVPRVCRLKEEEFYVVYNLTCKKCQADYPSFEAMRECALSGNGSHNGLPTD